MVPNPCPLTLTVGAAVLPVNVTPLMTGAVEPPPLMTGAVEPPPPVPGLLPSASPPVLLPPVVPPLRLLLLVPTLCAGAVTAGVVVEEAEGFPLLEVKNKAISAAAAVPIVPSAVKTPGRLVRNDDDSSFAMQVLPGLLCAHCESQGE
jgi:hypothetical protein